MMYVLLLVGFVFLIKGADFFVDGASAIARFFKVPSIIIGLTLVAMGTSAPEAAVSITAGLAGNSDISLGNIVGSNIFNLLVVIGVCAIMLPVISDPEILRRDMVWNIGVSILLFVIILDGEISRLDGVILLVGMATYLFVVIRNAMKNRTEEETGQSIPISKAIFLCVLGLAAVVFGGNLVVNNASLIASSLGLSDTLIGLTIVAVGTSLPELVTSIIASKKGDSGIAIGNAVGSCLFNIMFILGIASVLSPIHAVPELIIDAGILIGVTVVMLIFAKSKNHTSRLEGAICVAMYVAYSAYIIMR